MLRQEYSLAKYCRVICFLLIVLFNSSVSFYTLNPLSRRWRCQSKIRHGRCGCQKHRPGPSDEIKVKAISSISRLPLVDGRPKLRKVDEPEAQQRPVMTLSICKQSGRDRRETTIIINIPDAPQSHIACPDPTSKTGIKRPLVLNKKKKMI